MFSKESYGPFPLPSMNLIYDLKAKINIKRFWSLKSKYANTSYAIHNLNVRVSPWTSGILSLCVVCFWWLKGHHVKPSSPSHQILFLVEGADKNQHSHTSYYVLHLCGLWQLRFMSSLSLTFPLAIMQIAEIAFSCVCPNGKIFRM